MKKLLLFIALTIFGLGLNAQNVGDVTSIRYGYYSLEFTVTSVEPAECELSSYSGAPIDVTIPATVEIEGNDFSVTSIGNYTFEDCENLTSIEIPNSVTSIGNSAFYECSSLTSIVIPNSVTFIGGGAFYECSSLTNIEIPNSVTSIGKGAFSYCSSLTSIVIPNSVTSIGNYTFEDCENLTGIEIPNSVYSIGDYAFADCENLTSIELPNSVTSIGEGAFSGLESLTRIAVAEGNVVYDSRDNCNAIIETATNTLISGCQSTIIPNSVTSIGNSAFRRRASLTSIEIPNSVTSIGDLAFSGCSGLASIEIPNSVTSIGESAFSGCSSLTSIVIPNSVTFIGGGAFGCSNLRMIKCYAENVPETGYDIFDGCPSDMIILVPANSVDDYKAIYPWNEYNLIAMPEDGEPYVGDHVMIDYEGYSLIYIITDVENTECKVECAKKPTTPVSVTISSSVEISGKEYSVTSIGERAFSECKNLTNIEIPNSVTSIGDYAFADCENLTSIELPNSVTSIGKEAFYGCSSLTSIEIPNSITSIGNNAFSGCSSLTSIVIPESATSIEKYAFSWCSNLRIIKCYAENVPETGYNVFYGCPSDMIICVPAVSLEEYKSTSPWKDYNIVAMSENGEPSVGDHVMIDYEGYSLIYIITDVENTECRVACAKKPTTPVSVTISSSVEISGKEYSVTSIGGKAFYGCSSLTSIEIPNSVISIGNNAFSECESLTSIEIPNSVTSIGNSAFSECESLTSIEIPNSVTSIGDWAFSGCSSLTSIVVDYRNTVYDSRNNCNAIIETATNTLISGCQNTIIPNYVTSIGIGAFNGSSLTGIVIPESVTSIGNFAFRYCSNFTSITFGENSQLTSIGREAFSESGLASIKIPNSITSIGEEAFYNCRSLTNIEIPNSVTSIGDWAFYSCKSLTSIVIPESVTSIGEVAFSECSSLRVVKCYVENVPETGYDIFNSCPSSMKIYVPEISWGDYKSTASWNEFTLLSLNDYENLIPAALDTLYAEAINDAVVVLSWDKVEDATSYNVYSGYTLIEKVTNTALVVTGLVAETTYTFDVTVVNEFGESERKSVTVTTLKANDDGNDDGNDDENENPTDTIVPEPKPLDTPENLVAKAKSSSSILLIWDEAENAESYNIYQDDELIDDTDETEYLVENLDADTKYCFYVTAVRGNEESNESDEDCDRTDEEDDEEDEESIEELSSSINIYPNPVENELFLATEVRVEEISIYDIYGRQTKVYGLQSTDLVHSIDVAELEAGVYFVNIKTENGNIVKRFVKK